MHHGTLDLVANLIFLLFVAGGVKKSRYLIPLLSVPKVGYLLQ
jgi:hypothetical protein